MRETPLAGGRITEGVVRIGQTVRRPRQPNSAFVRALLGHLEQTGFDAAPRHLGSDDQGREIFSFIDGKVPPDLDAGLGDETLAAAGRLIRHFHDATAGSELAGAAEVVCHGDLSPCNCVFRADAPVALIDFDAAAPGSRLDDVGYAIFLWLNLGTDGPAATEQARRVGTFCAAYGVAPDERVVAAIIAAVAANIERMRTTGRNPADIAWWQSQLDWLEGHRADLLD